MSAAPAFVRTLPFESVDREDPILSGLMNFEDIVRFVRSSRGRSLFLHVSQFAPLKDQGSAAPGCTAGRAVSDCLQVSKATALKFLRDAYIETVAARVLVHVAYCRTCIFIGQSLSG